MKPQLDPMHDDEPVTSRMAVGVAIPIHETPTACAGAAAAYVLRRVAYRAGAYAPGIDEAIFDQLVASVNGGTVDDVARWFGGRDRALEELGYRLHCRRVEVPTPELCAWVAAGVGFRGAVLSTSYLALHPSASEAGGVISHAVGLSVEKSQDERHGRMFMIDPWSRAREQRGRVHPALERAHAASAHQGLALYWTGWA